MSVGAILTAGLGSFGSVNLLPTLGYLSSGTPPPPPPVSIPPPPRMVGGSGGINPRYSSLTHTKYLPGMRQLIEADDERNLKFLMDAVIKGRLN